MTCCEPTGRVWAESDVSILWKDCWSSSGLGFLHPLLAEARRVSEMRENQDSVFRPAGSCSRLSGQWRSSSGSVPPRSEEARVCPVRRHLVRSIQAKDDQNGNGHREGMSLDDRRHGSQGPGRGKKLAISTPSRGFQGPHSCLVSYKVALLGESTMQAPEISNKCGLDKAECCA
jgi:hypothetical protein